MKIINCLRKNARKTLVQLSRETDIPVSSLHSMLQRTNKTMKIRYTTIPFFRKIFPLYRVMLIVNPKYCLSIENYAINNIYKLTKGRYLLDCFFRNMAEADEFYFQLKMKNIAIDRTIEIIKTIMYEEFEVKE